METASPLRSSGRLETLVGGALLWLGPLLLLIGTLHYRFWEQVPSMRALEGLAIGLASLGAAWLAHRLSGRSLAGALATLWCLGLVLFAGPVPMLATVVLLAAALAVGTAIAPRESIGLQAALGLVVIAGAIGWLLPLPLHYGPVYLGAALGLALWRRRAIGRSIEAFGAAWSAATSAAPSAAAFGVVLLGLASTGAWLPTMQFDDLVYHLRLPWQLQMEGFYPLDPSTQVWALAPWASDVLHAVPQLIGGSEARGPVNVLWLTLAAGGLWRLGGALGAPTWGRWLAIALFASIPLTTTLLASMHTELPTTALLAWLMALVLEHRRLEWGGWVALAILGGGLFALKLTAAALAGVLLLLAVLRFPWPPVPRILALAGIFLFLAAPSYVYALAISGNPFLPLFNGWFHSPFFHDANMVDSRWVTGFGPMLLWDMTFETRRFLESHAGAGGFGALALVGAALLALFRPGTRMAMAVALALTVIPLLALQYLRYAYPGMVLLGTVAALAALRQRPRLGGAILVSVCLANLAFQANGHWMLANGAVRMSVGKLGADRPLLSTFTPERVLMRQLRKQGGPEGAVVFLDEANSYFAEAGRQGRAPVWYDPDFQQAAIRADAVPDGSAWVALLREEGASDVIVRRSSTAPVRLLALERAGARRLSAVGPAEWWRMPARQEKSR